MPLRLTEVRVLEAAVVTAASTISLASPLRQRSRSKNERKTSWDALLP